MAVKRKQRLLIITVIAFVLAPSEFNSSYAFGSVAAKALKAVSKAKPLSSLPKAPLATQMCRTSESCVNGDRKIKKETANERRLRAQEARRLAAEALKNKSGK